MGPACLGSDAYVGCKLVSLAVWWSAAQILAAFQ